jgi:hypothetical protein
MMHFSLGKWKALGTKTATGTTTLTGFYDGIAGTLTRVSIASTVQGTNFAQASMPEFTTAAGGEVPGALFHVVMHDPNSFVVIVERISGGPSEPLSGDLALTWTRRGKTH